MQTRKRYSKAFKLEAIRLFEESDSAATDVARELGIRRNQLYKWKQQFSEEGREQAFLGPGRHPAPEPQAELATLKRRVAQLEEENAILKKAATYFAKALP